MKIKIPSGLPKKSNCVAWIYRAALMSVKAPPLGTLLFFFYLFTNKWDHTTGQSWSCDILLWKLMINKACWVILWLKRNKQQTVIILLIHKTCNLNVLYLLLALVFFQNIRWSNGQILQKSNHWMYNWLSFRVRKIKSYSM